MSVLHLRRRNSRFNLFIRTTMAADYADSAAHSMRHFMRQVWLPACAPDSDPPAFDGLEETAFTEPNGRLQSKYRETGLPAVALFHAAALGFLEQIAA